MPAPTVTVRNPPPTTYPDTIPRPGALVAWTGGTGPFDVTHEWDTVNTFDSGALLQDVNAGATSPDVGTPPGDLGPAGTDWFYRVTVTDTSDAAATTSPTSTLVFFDPVAVARFLYLLANCGVGFAGDEPGGGWGPAPDGAPADGDPIDFARFLYLLANCGVGFDPTDTPPGGWGTGGEPGDGYTIDFDRFLYLLAGDVNTDTPTPHIWYVFPSFGEEGWEYRIVGYGFGDTQGTYSGTVTLNGLASGVIAWTAVAEASPDLTINPTTDVAEPVHQLVRAVVPAGATSGPVIVCTDGP